MISFFVEGKPVPQGSMKVINGHVLHAKGSELIYWRSAIGLKAKEFIKQPYTGAIKIKLEFGLMIPKTINRTYPTKYPDLDKLIRAVLDGLTGVGYVDDSQVVEILASKRYGRLGVYVEISDIEKSGENQKIF